jgi:coenzyme F420-reducing hydrogenase alpha subunit
MITFESLVEEIKKLSLEEKQEVKFLTEKFLIEERRNEIYKNYEESIKELDENSLEFSSDIDRLKEILYD